LICHLRPGADHTGVKLVEQDADPALTVTVTGKPIVAPLISKDTEALPLIRGVLLLE
jgi:hypothetical protein